jgi:L-methionine (R)-S-oxide reductase
MPCWKATRSAPRRWSRSLSSSGQAGRYRWVGPYKVTEQEIVAIGWSGPGAPVYPRFPVTQGLSGAAVAARDAVVVNDVIADPRYLTAFASTLSEAIIPLLDPGTAQGR